jgi:hypothetical protein
LAFNSGTGDHSPQAIAQALQGLVDRVQAECHLVLQPLRLILLTDNLAEAANFWNRELGLPEAGVSGGAVGKHISWGKDVESARSVVILHVGIAVGLVSGLSIATSTVIHEFGHVHDDLARGRQIGFPQPDLSRGLNWPELCAHFAELTWSEFAAESVAASYMTADDLRELMTNDPIHLAAIHKQLRQLIQSHKVGQVDFPSLWSRAVTDISDLFANLGRAAARFPFAENGEQARSGFVDATSEAASWKPIVDRLFDELNALGDKHYFEWDMEPFRGLGEVIAFLEEPPVRKNPDILKAAQETRALKDILKDIRRRWPDCHVLRAPLNRFIWGAEIGQKQIDADVQEGMNFHDRIWQYALTLAKDFPDEFDLAAIMQNQGSQREPPNGCRNQ